MTNDIRLKPGDCIGILGGGQLGRMLALAAARLGLTCHIFAPETDSPAFHVSAAHTIADYRDEAALAAFANGIGAATFEFENVPVEAVAFLEKRIAVRPGSKALAVAQDRILEKQLAREIGAMTVDFAGIESLVELERVIPLMGLPAILKTTRMGYDGKGQAKILRAEDAPTAYRAMAGKPAICERLAEFQSEVSVIAARGIDGAFRAFDVTQNEHRNHILHHSLAPARISPAAAADAIDITRRIAEALDYVGVLAVEFFALDFSRREILYVNEIAPRVHNSGHWTQNGALTDQFEQHIRAVAGWPLGATDRIAATAEMINLIGDDAADWEKLLAEPGVHLHLYGKAEARRGRKMGHVNRLSLTPLKRALSTKN
jgi:5-(carboxyamino)imidazole ribonucleotide synthase